ncbi:NusG domain II-containing protein [Proteiniborus sp. MB09-C3]|uniref:NusG domain II-containing protein n=1 Tax=Proteiniborus sp. MB09-C3 TaxID=3050072 RepID=UPI002552C8A0|nr:NusG domain II-containing protein [Proteiniborus sp. MB09-C3]WIV10592.1 NusG domain II-containing protein [Proteiniborus sp. MB09-C3]
MTKWDKYLIVFVLLLSLVGIYFVKYYSTNGGNKYISIQVDGKEIKKISFGANMVGKTIDIKTEFGYNKIEVGDERVRVIEADCPDKLDVKQGWISTQGEVIVCLPNRMVVEIKTEKNSNDEIDHISY